VCIYKFIWCTCTNFQVITFFFMYDIQHCFICRPLRFHCVVGCGIEPGTVATTALAVRRSNHSARSHPYSARSHPLSARSHPQVVIPFSAKNMGTQMILLAKDSQIKPLFFRINKYINWYIMYATFRQTGGTSQHIWKMM
jgi:hypothetical protein